MNRLYQFFPKQSSREAAIRAAKTAEAAFPVLALPGENRVK
jgi:hypothetical protein